VLISIQNEREWVEFCARFLEQPDLPARQGFRNNVERVAHRPMVDAYIADTFRSLPRDECAARLRAANTAFGFVNDVSGLSHHPALRRVTLDTPAGPVPVAAPAPCFSDGERRLGPVPALGEHTARVREEFAA